MLRIVMCVQGWTRCMPLFVDRDSPHTTAIFNVSLKGADKALDSAWCNRNSFVYAAFCP